MLIQEIRRAESFIRRIVRVIVSSVSTTSLLYFIFARLIDGFFIVI
jgi:hypothetical protein